MIVTKLELNHFRCARHVALTPRPKLNVFAGINGAGKTTILDAIALMLSWAIARIQSPEDKGREFPEKDINNDKGYAHLNITFDDAEKWAFFADKLSWRLTGIRKGRNTEISPNQKPIEDFLDDLGYWAKHIRDGIGNAKEQYNLPLFSYYPVNRYVADTTVALDVRRTQPFGLLETYEGALSGNASFHPYFEWYRNREDLENEQRAEAGEFTRDSQLETVRRAIQTFLPDVSKISVKRIQLRMEVEKPEGAVSVDQMSDGEKCLFAMVGDLARRLAIANPVADDPLQGEGIVLIDEIDLHLHPEWQRMVVPRLLETFPNCQFFITTHSPEVITHVRPENLFLLKRGQFDLEVEAASESYGKTADRILEDLMGLPTTRPDEVHRHLSNLFTAIAKGDISLAKEKVNELYSEIGNDPELAKAEVLIKRKELIGK